MSVPSMTVCPCSCISRFNPLNQLHVMFLLTLYVVFTNY